MHYYEHDEPGFWCRPGSSDIEELVFGPCVDHTELAIHAEVIAVIRGRETCA